MHYLTKTRFRRSGRPTRRLIEGVSLIEVLIAVLLSAIGLLALAGANVASIRYSKMSQYRGTATSLVSDLAERMRANKNGAASYALGANYETQGTAMTTAVTNATTGGARNGTHNTDCETYTQTCTAAQIAAYDLANWRLLVRDQLPEGAAIISAASVVYQPSPPAAAANTVVTSAGFNVWIAWRDPAVANPDEMDSTEARNADLECTADFDLGTDKSIRCSFFRINL